MDQKSIEQRALVVGIVVNIITMVGGFVVFFITGLKAMFLDAAFTAIAVASGGVAAILSKTTARTTQRYPNGKFALEPMYAIGKSIFTISLLAFSFIEVLREAIDYFFLGVRHKLEFGPVVIYQIAAVALCLWLVWYYRHENKRIGNVSTMLKAEANGTWVDGIISMGIGIVAVIVFLIPEHSPLDFLHYTGDFFITTAIVILTAKEPWSVLREAFVELVGGVHENDDLMEYVEDRIARLVPVDLKLDRVQLFKTGMNFDVQVFLHGTGQSIDVDELVGARQRMEGALQEKLHLVNVDLVFE